MQCSVRSGLGTAVMLPLFVLMCLVIGFGSGMLADTTGGYASLEMPPLSPPGWLFPVAWGVLYCLMGVSLWLVYRAGGQVNYYVLFVAQFVLNVLWVPLFFGEGMMVAALADLVALWVLVLAMISMVWGTERNAAYLLIPYLCWLTFAGYLTVGAIMLN